MIGPGFLLLLVSVGQPGPDGPPTNVYQQPEPSKITVHWTSGDVNAISKIYKDVSGWQYLDSVSQGVESYNTGLTSGEFGVSHFKNGQETSIISTAQ
jgi:hypothetical protein